MSLKMLVMVHAKIDNTEFKSESDELAPTYIN